MSERTENVLSTIQFYVTLTPLLAASGLAAYFGFVKIVLSAW